MKYSSPVLASLFLLFPAFSHSADSQSLAQQLQARAERGERQAVLGQIDEYLHNSEHRHLRFLKARLLAEAGRDDQAMAAYRELIDRYPDSPEPYNNLARLLAKQGRLKEAQQLLEKAMRTHPSYAAIYENLSVVFVELARDSYGKALRIKHGKNAVAMKPLTSLSADPATGQTTETASAAPTQNEQAREAPAGENQARQLARAPTPAATTPSPDSAELKQQLIGALHDWAGAWSEQAVTRYLGFYAPDYRPADMNRRAWQRQRRNRLSAPNWIEVELSDFEVTELSADRATVRVIQVYRSNTYQDRTRKQFRLRRGSDGWQISQEITLEQLPL